MYGCNEEMKMVGSKKMCLWVDEMRSTEKLRHGEQEASV